MKLIPLLLLTAVTACAGPTDQQQLIAILGSDAPLAEKALTCKRLAIYGNRDAVPALAPLLADEKLASVARIALEAIPDAAAGTALIEALGKLQGKLLVGVINTLGIRHDPAAGAALVAKLKDADPAVVAAAAVALGRIGGDPVATALVPLLAQAPDAVRPAVAEGCLLCAGKFAADGQSAAAVQLFDTVRAANLAPPQKLEATRGAILARQAAGVPLLAGQLQSPDRPTFYMALRTARDLPGREVAQLLAAELPRAAADRQSALLLALAERGDAEALPVVINAAKSGPMELRITAVTLLGQRGDLSSVPVLVDAAAADDARLAQAARSALVKLPGAEVDAAVVAMLKQSALKARLAGIELVGARCIASALPSVLQAAKEPEVRDASLKVLGELAGSAELPALLGLLAETKSDAVEAALASICARQAGRAACADQILPALARSEGPVQLALLRVLRSAGGPKALAALRAAAADANAGVKETALRALCEWDTPDALPDLVQLAQTATDPKWKILALRGQFRLIPLQTTAADQKLTALKAALALAGRTEEKRLGLAALAETTTPEALRCVTTFLSANDLREEAITAAVAIAEKIVGSHPTEVAEALKQVTTKNKQLAQRIHQLQVRAGKK